MEDLEHAHDGDEQSTAPVLLGVRDSNVVDAVHEQNETASKKHNESPGAATAAFRLGSFQKRSTTGTAPTKEVSYGGFGRSFEFHLSNG